MKHSLSTMLLILLFGLSTSAFSADLEDPAPPPPPTEWTVPDCGYIQSGVPITYTTDEGLSYAHASQMRFVEYCLDLKALDQANTLLAITTDYSGGYLLRSFDAGCKWKIEARLPFGAIYLATGPDGIVYLYHAGGESFYRWDGKTLQEREAPDAIHGFAVDPLDASHIRIGSDACQLYESMDGGLQFVPVGEPATDGYNAVNTVEFNPHQWDQAMCGTLGAYRTDDAGQTWEPIVPFDPLKNDRVHHFEFSPDYPGLVWARANMDIWGQSTRDLLLSADGGVSFESVIQQGDESVDQDGVVRAVKLDNAPTMAVHPDDPDILYFVCAGFFLNYATDLFRYNVSTGELSVVHLDKVDGISSIAFNPSDASVIYLGMAEENDPAPGPKLPEPPEVNAEAISVTVAPNPFNPAAEIRFSLPEAAQVKLEIFNITGQRIGTIVDGYLNAGDHAFTWDGSRVASGVYMYRLQAGETVKTEKMMLLK